MRLLSVVGNRPQFIKSAPLSLALRAVGIDEIVLHTGQHWDPGMSAVFFSELDLGEPKYRLEGHTADVAATLGKKPQSLSPARDALLKKGLIYSGERGRIAFTVPLTATTWPGGLRAPGTFSGWRTSRNTVRSWPTLRSTPGRITKYT